MAVSKGPKRIVPEGIDAAGDLAREAALAPTRVKSREYETGVEKIDGRGGLRPGAGRPTKYTPELAAAICARLASGRTLTAMCEEDDDLPHRNTVYQWIEEHFDFRAMYSRARVMAADAMDDRMVRVADETTPATAQADMVKFRILSWRAARLNPKEYGEQVMIQKEVRFGFISNRPHTEEEWLASLKHISPSSGAPSLDHKPPS